MQKQLACLLKIDGDYSLYSDPFRNLIAEVLCRAIRDYLIDTTCDKAEEHRRTAKRWLCINSKRPITYEPFEYGWVCEHLDLDPQAIRSVIIKQRDNLELEFVRYLTGLPNTQ